MKVIFYLCLLLVLVFQVGCQKKQENMVLLDEKVKKINIAISSGVGDMNQEVFLSITDRQSMKVFEKAIETAINKKAEVNNPKPDYDVMVEYEEGFPAHAIHLWLGEENEESIFMYMVGEGDTYLTSSKTTNQLRAILLEQ
ncbi:hypothetical protein [Bacillus sp. MRMR6]|uniref:hypothetical protein n=1 Tax=Bacillus sp. MRMR6 TaxID=1928617 RepID=UPI000952BCC1|nr:hypothetical protein [Bacillus sp. MRMR6]OLS33359.1 hypothetical protein BTR25_26370 [Bacillus sp. MRMR6]